MDEYFADLADDVRRSASDAAGRGHSSGSAGGGSGEAAADESLFGFVRSTASSLAGTTQQRPTVSDFSRVDIVLCGQAAAYEACVLQEQVQASPLAKNLNVRFICARAADDDADGGANDNADGDDAADG